VVAVSLWQVFLSGASAYVEEELTGINRMDRIGKKLLLFYSCESGLSMLISLDFLV
jgi:hypothetical protein